MSDAFFVSRTGRRMPVPTRASYFTSKKRLPREATNRARLSAARNYFGHVYLRLVPQVRMLPDHPNQYGALLGQALTIRFAETVDVTDFLGDVTRFIRGWRPGGTARLTGSRRLCVVLRSGSVWRPVPTL